MMRRLRTTLGILLLVLCGRAYASSTAVLRVTGSEQQGDAGSLTISFNGHSETVAYGQYSSTASIASAFGGVFARDFGAAVCVHAVGQAIVVTLRGDRSFGAITVTGSTSSFQIDQSAWPAQGGQGNPLITLQCVPSTLTVGNPATCTASVSASATGTVTFSLDSGGPLANVPLSSGSVILSNILSDTSVGSHLITAAYSGDSSHPASTAVASILVSSAPPPLNTATVYSFSIKNPDGSSGYTANGNVQGYADSVNGTWSNLSYDGVNRLTGGTRVPVTGSQQYFCWSYDSFGNRTLQASSGAPFQSGSPTCQASASAPATTYGMSYDGNNRIIQTPYSSPSYDAAGNTTSDDTNQYLYDDEGRVCAVKGVPPIVGLSNNGMVQYIYDAEGRRVAKGTINVFSCDLSSNGFSMTSSYVLDLSGNQVTEMDGDGEWAHTNVYAAGQLLATYDDEGVHFHLSDWLGSRRVQTDYLGRIESTYQNLPFGEFLPNNNASQNLGATEHHFTGKERDTESGNDYFGARYYASSMGRWMSPDWSKTPTGVPYADLSNPQTLNLYSYVKNNPLSSFDDDGHATIEIRYTSIGPGYTHSYIVVTDRNGAQTYFRAGPSAGGPSSGSPGALSSASGGSSGQSSNSNSNSSNSSSPGSGPGGANANTGPFGALHADSGSYVPGTIDYETNPAASSTLLSNDQPAAGYLDQLQQYSGTINQSNIPYNPLTTNSNAYAAGAANFLGLTVPKPAVNAPGSGTPLPVPPPPPPAPPPPPPCSAAGACPK